MACGICGSTSGVCNISLDPAYRVYCDSVCGSCLSIMNSKSHLGPRACVAETRAEVNGRSNKRSAEEDWRSRI
ncbi:hypothetical protein ACFL08_04860 [Patescibacteria group bacterium]